MPCASSESGPTVAEALPLPPAISDATYSDLAGGHDLMVLDDAGRDAVRRMLAQAYQIGYADGRRVTLQARSIDAYVANEKRQESERAAAVEETGS